MRSFKDRMAIRAALVPAKLGTSTRTQTGCSDTPAGHQEECLRSMSKRASAGRLAGPGLLSLPPDVLIDFTYRLDERDLCSLELINKGMSSALSAFNRGPGERWLDLSKEHRLLRPEASSWLLKRIRRYNYISWDYYNTVTKGTGKLITRPATCALPPLLPSLLAACAPSTKLSLAINRYEGRRFLGMASATIAPAMCPELSSLWASLQRHLTNLSLRLNYKEVEGPCLGNVNMLTALQKLTLYGPYSFREAFALKLPHLLSLQLAFFEQGELVLSCPELIRAEFDYTSLRITIEDAALEDLVLSDCEGVHVAMAHDQLQNLKLLVVQRCSEVGRRLIEEVSEMRNLRTLAYEPFPAACMPTSFPPSLQELFLLPLGWYRNLPQGLKSLQQLRVLRFDTKPNPAYGSRWEITRPLNELLPLDSLDYLELGSEVHVRTHRGAFLESRWNGYGLGHAFATRAIQPYMDFLYYKTDSCSCERPHLSQGHKCWDH